MKICACCGRRFENLNAFRALRRLVKCGQECEGVDDGHTRLVYRNCTCGSTLAWDIGPSNHPGKYRIYWADNSEALMIYVVDVKINTSGI